MNAATRAIYDIGYTGVCTFETQSPTHDRIADTKVQMKTFLSALERAGVAAAAKVKRKTSQRKTTC